MAFFRQWFLMVCALLAGGGQLFAASSEQRNYATALQAFQDGLYPAAEIKFTQFLQNYRKSTNAPMALLLLAQSEYHQKNYLGVINRLGDPAAQAKAKAAGLADGYVYWRAEAQFARSDFAGAALTFVSLTEDYPNSPLALSAAVEAAKAYAEQGEWAKTDGLLDGPDGVFQRAAQRNPMGELVVSGRLLQAQSKCGAGRFAAALEILNRLDPAALAPEPSWRRSYWLYQASRGAGNLDAALAATAGMLQVARAGHGDFWATNLAESVNCLAAVLEKKGQLAAASAALQENLSVAPAGQQQQAILKLADLAVAQKNLTNASARLDAFLSDYPDSPAAGVALLAVGELHVRDYIAQNSADVAPATNLLASARVKLNRFLATATNSPLLGRGYLARGWCDWLENQYPQSLTNFEAAAAALPFSEDLAVARFKTGDARFMLNDFAGAEASYQSVLADFSSLPAVTNALGGRAWYQILRARLNRHEPAGVDEAMRQLLAWYLTGAPADAGRLLAGQGLSDYNLPVRAREVLARFQQERTNSSLLPEVAFAIGRTYEREENWAGAFASHQSWLQTYPTNALRPEVEYARDWVVYQTNEAAAFELFTNYLSEYASTLQTPRVLWWVADHYFRLGSTNLPVAEKYYQLIFQTFPANELADPAKLMAGRAAMGWGGYKDAIEFYLSPLLKDTMNDTNCPADLALQGQLAYCEAARRLQDTNIILLATNMLAQICAKYPASEPGALAWSETGECNYQLGAYDAATNAFAQAASSPAASLVLRDRALVGLGIVLEKKAEGEMDDSKKALLDQAMASYEQVFYSDADPKDEFYTKKAALQMLELNNKTGSLKGADLDNFITRLEKMFPQLKETLELKRLALKN